MRLRTCCFSARITFIFQMMLTIFVNFEELKLIPNQSALAEEIDITKVICDRISGLSEEQRKICMSHPDTMIAVGNGIHIALKECRRQFKDQRWNCSIAGKQNSFGYVFPVGSREASFIHAITSAAVTYSIASACSKGVLNGCGCEVKKSKSQLSENLLSLYNSTYKQVSSNFTLPENKKKWRWSGCSINVDYGTTFSRKFLDARETEKDSRSLMNLHNNQVGRKAVKRNLRIECKCHGMSGSCSLKTCWKTLPNFEVISNYLMDKYWQANGVIATVGSEYCETSGSRSLRKGKNKSHHRNLCLTKSVPRKMPKSTELVYLDPSPNYCEKDIVVGSLGTTGRVCNRTSAGMDGCSLMCCGRGYNIRQYVKQWQCRCKFYWCCYVTCDLCSEKSEQYVCK